MTTNIPEDSKRQKTIDLINKLLAKAESTTFPEEAELASAQAERLMLRLGIDDAMLAAEAAPTADDYCRTEISLTGRYAKAHMMLAYKVLNALGNCFVAYYDHRGGVVLIVYGRKTLTERNIALVNSLVLQSQTAMKVWWKRHRADYALYKDYSQFVARRQFVISFGTGAAARIREERKVAEREVTGAALVVRSEAERSEEFAKSTTKFHTGRATSMRGSDSARQAGFAAGKRANVGTTALSA